MKYISTSDAPAAVGPYSQGVIAGNFLYTAGQIALTPQGSLANQTIEDETRQVMANLTAILAAGGCRLSDVVHVRIYITAKELFPQVNKIYAEYFSDDARPARECVVASPPVDGAHVEISMIAELSSS
jgi:2-iminobutanoate/2-iminopropanoate deaminase